MIFLRWQGILGLILIITCNQVVAEIFKCKDAQGRWIYTEKPQQTGCSRMKVNKNNSISTRHDHGTAKSNKQSFDIKETLIKTYNPGSAIEHASLATITIQTPISVGSGFFISADGYILTNRHVIRPSETQTHKERTSFFHQQQDVFTNAKLRLDNAENELRQMEKTIKQYDFEIKSPTYISDKQKLMEERDELHKLYMQRKEQYQSFKKEYDEKKRIFDKEKLEYEISRSMTRMSRNFKIILKDKRELKASLVSVSKDFDLALLKLDHHVTPFIKPSSEKIRQTMKVYAVGSPLGIRDSITAGIVTGVNEDKIITDTKLLPGNSGGPLLTEQGEVIGINSSRIAQELHSEGLGVAIMFTVVKREFQQYLGK